MSVIRHPDSVVVHAPAKLNLFLEILSRRTDGYHELETLMVAISIYDTLIFSPDSTDRLTMSCHWGAGTDAHREQLPVGRSSPWDALPEQAENLAFRALALLRERSGYTGGGTLRLLKRIPSAAGLGGASSDAAAALAAANAVWSLGWSRDRLSELAAELGSDVPFFLGSSAALCRGRGERLTPAPVPRLSFVVVRPPAGLSTPAVYGECRVPSVPRSSEELLTALHHGNPAAVGRRLHNRLQPAAAALSPLVHQLEEAFESTGADCGHQLTGSGSSYFGVCRHRRHAHQLAGRLRATAPGAVFVAHSLASPVPARHSAT